MNALLRLWYRLTGKCVSFRPDERGICKVCRWEREPDPVVEDYTQKWGRAILAVEEQHRAERDS